MAAGKIILNKASGGVLNVTSTDGATSTDLVLPLSGTVASTDGATIDNTVPRYDGVSGKLQGSGVVVDDSNNITANIINSNSYVRITNGGITSTFAHDASGSYLDVGNTNYRVYANGAERMRIDTAGNIGVGVIPSAWEYSWKAIDINQIGSIAISSASNNIIRNAYLNSSLNWIYKTNGYAQRITQNSDGTTSWFNAPSGIAGNPLTWTTVMSLDASGRLIVSGAPASGYISLKGDVSFPGISVQATGAGYWAANFTNSSGTQIGNIVLNASSTSYNTSSDYRLKEDWKPMENSIERLMSLKPCNFKWKETGNRVDGFLAHELQEVAPEVVTGSKDAMKEEEYEVSPRIEATYDADGNELTPLVEAVIGKREVPDYQGIDQSKLVPLLTSALQDAIKEINDLKTRIEVLEAK